MRVLLVGAHHPGVGGAQLYSSHLSRELTRMGHRVEVLSYRGAEPFSGEVVHNLEVPDVPVLRGAMFVKKASSWISKNAERFDLIVANYAKTSGAALGMAGVEGVVVFHGTDVRMNPLLKKYVSSALGRGRAVAVSRYLAEIVREEFGVRSKVIPGAVDKELFENLPGREECRRILGLGDGPLVLTVASLVPVKGVDDVLRVASKVRVTFLVAGDGPLRGELERTARKMGVNVRFLGYVDHGKLPILMRACDLLLHMPRFEGYGLVVLEALASGTPVVARRVGAIPEILVDGGVLVNSVEEAASAVEDLLENRGRLESMRDVARRRILSRTWTDVAREFVELYLRDLSF